MSKQPQEMDVVLLDSYSLLFRAFHAFPLSLTSPDGQLTNAVFGFTKLLLDAISTIHPDYFLAAVDMGEATFRHEQYTDYKANREEAPSELKQQISLMHEVLESLSIPVRGFVGYEADDVIGTYAAQLRTQNSDLEVGIFTGDRDSFQLVGDNIYVLLPEKKHRGFDLIDTEGVIDKFGVRPDQVIDYKALCGDASDNIPGVKGVGPKTAAKLLHEFSTLENIYIGLALAANQQDWLDTMHVSLSEQQAGELRAKVESLPTGVINKLSVAFDNAFLSQQLARIDTAVPMEFDLEEARMSRYDKSRAMDTFERLGFKSLIRHLPQDQFESAVQESLF